MSRVELLDALRDYAEADMARDLASPPWPPWHPECHDQGTVDGTLCDCECGQALVADLTEMVETERADYDDHGHKSYWPRIRTVQTKEAYL